MIPDGGGMTAVKLASAVKEEGGFNEGLFPYATPVKKGPMYISQYWVGAETTHSASHAVTDSAAGGTALSTGKKTVNKYVGVDPNVVPIANILEASQRAGKLTGLAVTVEWTNATPATFAAHDINRSNTAILAEQMLNQDIDVVLGLSTNTYYTLPYHEDEALEGNGYSVIKTKTDLGEVKKGDRLWSKFVSAAFSTDTANKATSPTLLDMTKASITALADADEDGFFLMVEGSRVDSGGHNNNAFMQVGEFLAFDAACEYAIEFAKGRDDTIVLIAPDHDTGGIHWADADLPSIVEQIRAGKETIAEVKWTGTNHTAWNGGVFIYAPEGVSYPAGIDVTKKDEAFAEFEATNFINAKTNLIDNTDIAKYLAGFIGVDLDELSKDLFVDVTDQGTYDSATQVFTFNNTDSGLIKVRRNESVATHNGIKVDLEGEIAVYCNDRFYVPKKLIEKTMGSGVGFDNVDVTERGTYNTETETFKFTDVDVTFKNFTNVLVYKGQEIDMGEDVAVYKDGKFTVPGKALELIERLESGEFGEISVIADCNMHKINVSGWVGAPNAKISLFAVEEGANLAGDFDAGKIIAMTELKSDYNGDYETSIAVQDEDVAGNYKFYINYKGSNSKDAKAMSFTFKNTVPTMDVVNGNGEELMYMEQLREGDTVRVDLKGFNFDDDFNGAVLVAQYDKEGSVIKTDIFDDVDTDTVEQGTEISKSTKVIKGAHEIKVMYWNYNTICPVFGVYKIYTRNE